MAHWEAVAHREVILPGVGIDNFQGRAAEGNGVVAHGREVAHHQPGQAGQLPTAVQVQHHPVNVVEVLVQVFQKQDAARETRLRSCARDGLEQAQVAAHQRTGSGAGPVEDVRCHGNGLKSFSEQGPAQGFEGPLAAFLMKQHRHHAVDAGVAQGQQVAVEHGDVGEAGHPLGLGAEAGKIEPVHDAGRAVAAPGAEDGPDAGVVELPLEIAAAQGVVAGKLVVVAGNALAQHHLQAPVLEGGDGGGQLGGADFAGGAHKGYALAGLQGGRELNRHEAKKKSNCK